MIKILGAKKTERDKEEEKKGGEGYTKKKAPGELRLKKELGELDLPSHAKVVFPDDNNIMNFEVTIDLAKEECLWKGATYKFTVAVPPNYPHEPPRCHCETMIYHPNIDLKGNVCLNILRQDWKPVLGINAVILGLIFLFIEPNPNDPLNKEAAETMRNNIATFNDNVKRSLRGATISGTTFPKLL